MIAFLLRSAQYNNLFETGMHCTTSVVTGVRYAKTLQLQYMTHWELPEMFRPNCQFWPRHFWAEVDKPRLFCGTCEKIGNPLDIFNGLFL
jgi:hypothetical protein